MSAVERGSATAATLALLLVVGCSEDEGSRSVSACRSDPVTVVERDPQPVVSQPANDPTPAAPQIDPESVHVSLTFFAPPSLGSVAARPQVETAVRVRAIQWVSRTESPYEVLLLVDPDVRNEIAVTWLADYDGVGVSVAEARRTISPPSGSGEVALQLFPTDFDVSIDDDGDGVSNLDELKLGTDPLTRAKAIDT